MSLAEIEQRAFSSDPQDTVTTTAGIPIESAAPYADDTRFADFFTANPKVAHVIWQDTKTHILDSDFDPRQAYLEGFTVGLALRESRAMAAQAEPEDAFVIPKQPTGEDVLPPPTEPDAAILLQLGETSMMLAHSREYYQGTL